NEHLGDAAGHRRRHLDGRLLRLDLDEGLTFGHFVAGRDLDVEDVTARQVLAQLRKLDFAGHAFSLYERTGSGCSGSIFNSRMASSTRLGWISPRCARRRRAATAMHSASTSKNRRKLGWLSLRPNPSVPSE